MEEVGAYSGRCVQGSNSPVVRSSARHRTRPVAYLFKGARDLGLLLQNGVPKPTSSPARRNDANESASGSSYPHDAFDRHHWYLIPLGTPTLTGPFGLHG